MVINFDAVLGSSHPSSRDHELENCVLGDNTSQTCTPPLSMDKQKMVSSLSTFRTKTNELLNSSFFITPGESVNRPKGNHRYSQAVDDDKENQNNVNHKSPDSL